MVDYTLIWQTFKWYIIILFLLGMAVIVLIWNDYFVPNAFKKGDQIEKYRILPSIFSNKEFKREGDRLVEFNLAHRKVREYSFESPVSKERMYHSLPARNVKFWEEQLQKAKDHHDSKTINLATNQISKWKAELKRSEKAPKIEINSNKRDKGTIIASNTEDNFHTILAVKEPFQINPDKTHVEPGGPGSLKIRGQNLAGNDFTIESAVIKGEPGHLEDHFSSPRRKFRRF